MLESLRRCLEGDSRISYAILFGSSARGTPAPDSDVDVAVGVVRGVRFTALELGDLASRLEAATGRRVDLILMEEAQPGMAYRIFRDGRVILERDRPALVARRARAMIEYLDFRPIEELCARGVLAAAVHGR